MNDSVKLNQAETRFQELDYPVSRDEAAARYAETTVVFADGEANLGDLIDETPSGTFDSPDELFAELHTAVPIEAVGEPGQSDGDA